MRDSDSSVTIDELCKLFDKSRQAYYQNLRFTEQDVFNEEIILQFVSKVRHLKPRCGGRKLHIELKKDFISRGIKVGRDAFFNILRDNNLLIKKRRTQCTTMSFHKFRKYSNLIKDLEILSSNKLWVSDITYIQTAKEVVYLSLITDAYSRKIVGWYLSDNLTALGSVRALQKAISTEELKSGLIHHSDRGIQYCSNAYVKILKQNNISISMTENSDPRENAIAERINGILKDEWLKDLVLEDLEDAREKIEAIINIYNTNRLHMSIDYLTPEQAHQMSGEIKKCWKSYYKNEAKCSL